MGNKNGYHLTIFVILALMLGGLLLPPVRLQFTGAGIRWLYILLLSFLLSFCLTPVFAAIARKFNIMDNPDARKGHFQSTPLLGGGAVFLGIIGGIVLNGIINPGIGAILASATLLFVTGIIDDIRGLPAGFKIAVQCAAAVLVIAAGVVLNVFPDRFGYWAMSGNVFLTMFWIIGITNAMNFFDGMDGLAAGLGAMISFFLALIAFQTDQPFLGWVSLSVMGGCLGFLPYNLKANGASASIFLGDAGSITIGFVLSCIAVYGKWSETNPVVALVSPLLIFWVLIFDMVYITLDRVMSGKVKTIREWLEYVGQDHLHHRLAKVIGCPKKSVVFIYMMSLCLGISALVLRHAGPAEAVLLIIQALVLVGLISVLERYGRAGEKTRLNENRKKWL